jgi:hypothetical protein
VVRILIGEYKHYFIFRFESKFFKSNILSKWEILSFKREIHISAYFFGTGLVAEYFFAQNLIIRV